MESGDHDSQISDWAEIAELVHANAASREIVASAHPIGRLIRQYKRKWAHQAGPDHAFVGSDSNPSDLHRNIVKIARNASPPPFRDGRFQPVQSLPSSFTGVIDPQLTGSVDSRLPPIARKWEYAEKVRGEHDAWEYMTQEQPRYEPCLQPNRDQQNRAVRSREHDQCILSDQANESGDVQCVPAERTGSAVVGAYSHPTAASAYPLLAGPHLPVFTNTAQEPRLLRPPLLPAPSSTAPGNSSVYENQDEEEQETILPHPKRRKKTTNAEPPSHPPPDTVYEPGTTSPIPPEILSLVTQIKTLPRKHKKASGSARGGGGGGYPMPTKLRSIPGMNSRNGYISKSSPLMKWYGDTRLFTEKWWKWLYVGGKARRELEKELGDGDEL